MSLSSKQHINVAQAASIAHAAVREYQRRRGNMGTRQWQHLHFAAKKVQVDRVRYVLMPAKRRPALDPFIEMNGVEERIFSTVVSNLKPYIFPEQ